MDEQTAIGLNPGELVYFPENATRQASATGRTRERAGELYVQIQEAVKRPWVRAKDIEILNITEIEDKIASMEFSSNLSLRQHLVFQKLCGRLVDVIYSMEATNTDFKAYQFKAVLKALEAPGKGILIADEVGLGKTIEAGLVWTELKARYDYNRLLVICPASLKKKWVSELENRFNTRDAVDCKGAADLQECLEKTRRPGQGFVAVASYQSLLPPKDEHESSPRASLHRLMDEMYVEESPIDLLVLDEAHYIRNQRTKSYKSVQSLMGLSTNAIFLSATPVHATSDNLYALLHLLDEDFFQSKYLFETMVNANEDIIKAIRSFPPGSSDVSMLREHVSDALKNGYFRKSPYLPRVLEMCNSDRDWTTPKNRTELLEPLEKVNLFNQYVVRNRKRDVIKERVQRRVEPIYVELSDEELDAYQTVVDAGYEFMELYDLNNESFIISNPERQITSSIAGTVRGWISLKQTEDEPDDKNIGRLKDHLRRTVPERCDFPSLRRCDSKFNALKHTLDNYFATNPGKKIILFAFFKPTLSYLQHRLEDTEHSSVLISGDIPAAKRWEMINDFETNDDRVLLCSEVGAEGIDLQFCSAIINYDLPWNPMKIEQRIGRIDRIGQEAARILIFNFICKDTIDHCIYDKLWQKISVFENTIGDIESIIDNEISDLTKSIITHRFSHRLNHKEIEQQIIQKATAIENILKQERELEENSADFVAFYDVINQKIENTRISGKWVSSHDVEFLIKDFFKRKYKGTEFKNSSEDRLECEIKLSEEADQDYRYFLQEHPSLKTDNLIDDRRFTKIRFSDKYTPKLGDEFRVVIDQFHPLTRFAIWEMEDEMKAGEFGYHPLIRCVLPLNDLVHDRSLKNALEGYEWAFFFIERWTFQAAHEIEKLFYVVTLPDGHYMDDVSSDTVVNLASRQSSQFADDLDISPEVLEHLFEGSKEIASTEAANFKIKLEEELQNKSQIQISALNRSTRNKVIQWEDRVQDLLNSGKDPRSMKGRIEALQRRTSQRISEISGIGQNLTPQFDDICAGVIEIQ